MGAPCGLVAVFPAHCSFRRCLVACQVRKHWTHVSNMLPLPLSAPLPDVAGDWSRHSSLTSFCSEDIPASFFEPVQRFPSTVQAIEIRTVVPTWAEVRCGASELSEGRHMSP